MTQTGYAGITALSVNLPFNGGFCQWFYTPIENIAWWPPIDPATQFLSTEPLLVSGATWYGPIKVPDHALGFEEAIQKDKPGISYKQKIYGSHPGDSAQNRINLENLPYHEFVIVAQQRAGGLFLIFGDDKYGMSFLDTFKNSGKEIANTEFSFVGDSIKKALILPTFLGINVSPPPSYTQPPSPNQPPVTNVPSEIIFFTNQSTVTIPWTTTRQQNYGAFPTIQVWFTDTGTPELANVPIQVDQAPPNQTLFIVQNSGPSSGFIILN